MFYKNLPFTSLATIAELKAAISVGQTRWMFKRVGAVGRKDDVHKLITTNKREWYKSKDLGQVLETKDFRKNLDIIKRVQLASLIAITHLHFAKLRLTSTEVSRTNIVYYNHSSDTITWDEKKPFVLNPYLSVDFVNRRPASNIGGSSGRSRNSNNIVAELGLLLYQIGSNSMIDYGRGAEGFRKAKEEARHSLHRVDRGAGSRYAEVTQMYLEWKTPTRIPGLDMKIGGFSGCCCVVK
jgi:hypothetical protein